MRAARVLRQTVASGSISATVPKLPPCFTTGVAAPYLRGGPLRDELLGLIRIGIKFYQNHHAGGHPGFLRRYITGIVTSMAPPMTFERLLVELEIQAARRNLAGTGDDLPPVESVNRAREEIVYYEKKKERIAQFSYLRNIFTQAKKDNSHARQSVNPT